MVYEKKRMLKFEELAEKRVNEVVKRMQLLGNLSNTSNYEYTQQHVNQIFKAIKAEVKVLQHRFENKGKEVQEGFKFNIQE